MMDTKKVIIKLGLLLVACAISQTTYAQTVPTEPLARVGLIDAKSPTAITVVGKQPIALGSLRFYHLSSPTFRGVECCLTILDETVDSTVLRYHGADTFAVTAQVATFDLMLEEGFFGLALVGSDVRVKRINSHKVIVSWKRHRGKVDVEHCLSTEGLHVRLSHLNQSVNYYLPLGMTVEPNCPTSMLR